MPALILDGERVNLSYSYDALTIYPTCPSVIDDVISCVNQCGQFPFVMRAGADDLGEPTEAGSAYQSCFYELITKSNFQRFVRHRDDDHSLYHQDKFSLNLNHSHIKFRRSLTRAEVFRMIELFEENGLLIKEQKEAFMRAFDKRYAELRAAIDGSCAPEEKTENLRKKRRDNFRELLALIKVCEDNDKLANLHEYLLEEKFDYLREFTKYSWTKEWQGTARSGETVRTSEAWARLEKAISLRMIRNLQEQSQQFTPEFGKEREAQLTNTHSFFGIKRSRPLTEADKSRTFKTLDAFASADEATLNKKYKKTFGS